MKKNSSRCVAVSLSMVIAVLAWADASASNAVVRQEGASIDLFEFRPGEGFRLEFLAPPGEFGVEFSENLQAWDRLSTVSAVDGRGTFTDPGALTGSSRFYRVTGSFTTSEYHFLEPSYGVEAGGAPGQQQTGDLWFMLIEENIALQHANEEEGLFAFDGLSWDMEGRVRPLSHLVDSPRLKSVVERVQSGAGESESHLFEFQADGLSVPVPEENVTMRFTSLEGDRDFLRGRIVGSFSDEGEAGVGVPFMARKSVNATADMLEGEWGLVVFRVEVEDGGGHGVGYEASAVGGDIAADGGATFQDAVYIDVFQGFDGDGILIDFDSDSIGGGHFDVASDGSTGFGPDAGSESEFRGFVSPSGNMFVMASSRPARHSLPEGVDRVEDDQPDRVDMAYALGVRRDAAPDLAGKSYRVLRHGFLIAPNTFEIDISPEHIEETLTFSANGESASRSAMFEAYWTSFDGQVGFEQYGTDDLEYGSVSIDGGGMIVATGSLGSEDSSARLIGFSHDDGRILVLADGITDDGHEANLGLIIAIRQ